MVGPILCGYGGVGGRGGIDVGKGRECVGRMGGAGALLMFVEIRAGGGGVDGGGWVATRSKRVCNRDCIVSFLESWRAW